MSVPRHVVELISIDLAADQQGQTFAGRTVKSSDDRRDDPPSDVLGAASAKPHDRPVQELLKGLAQNDQDGNDLRDGRMADAPEASGQERLKGSDLVAVSYEKQ